MAVKFKNSININDQYTFPSAVGTDGQYLSITDAAAGTLDWTNIGDVDGLKSNFVYYDAKNSTGSTIPAGTAVMAVGSDGNSGHVLIAPMNADGSVEPKYFIGVTDGDISNGQIGKVVHFGIIDKVNTNAFSDGDILWCDPSNPGGFTTTEPSSPSSKIATAIVINSSTNGKLLVRVQGNEGIHELHDVNVASVQDGQVLTYDAANGYWKNIDQLQPGQSVIYTDNFTGDSNTTVFTLSNEISSENNTSVYFDGVYQSKSNYSLSADQLTFVAAPPLSVDIEVISIKNITLSSPAEDDYSAFYPLISDLDAEETARIAADNTLQDNINIEAQSRASADSALQSSIDTINAKDIVLNINGDASGTATFTNLGDATLTLTVADDSHNHVISNVDGLQAALDLKASTSYVDTSVANLIDSAPGALDTLNELAAALGDDANFAGTVTTALAGKQPIGTYNTIIGTDADINTSGAIVIDQLNMTDGVIQSHSTRTMTLGDLGYTGATNANYITNNNQLTNGAGYLTNLSSQTISYVNRINTSDGTSPDDFGYNNRYQTFNYAVSSGLTGPLLSFGGLGDNYPMQITGAYNGGGNAFKVRTRNGDTASWNPWRTLITDGNISTQSVSYSATSGDANLLDGLNSTQFLRSDADDTATGSLTFAGAANFTNGSNQFNGHLYYNAYDSNGNHYPHFRDGSNANGVNINWRLYSGASLITHTWNYTDTNFVNSLRSTVDMRAPIFYDSNNTAYYLNPAGLSVVSDLAVRLSGDVGHSRIQIGDIPNGTGGRIFTSDNRYRLVSSVNLYDTGASSWARDASAGAAAINLILSNTTSGTGRIQFLADASGSSYPTNQMTVWGEGYVTADGSFRAPIFYDSNNTSYYLDPANTSKSAHLRGKVEIINESPVLILNDYNSTNTTNQVGYISFQKNGTETGYAGFGSASSSHFYLNNEDGIIYLRGNYTLSNNSSRAPIFYDSDNTGYYTNPASTSNLNALNVITLTETSALRFKENIKEDIDASIVDKLRPVSYDWKQTKEKDYGFIAEEVNELDEDLVTKNADGEMSAIKYTKLIPFLVKKIQEQEARIKQLENGNS